MQGLPAIPNILKLKGESSTPRRVQDSVLIALFLLPALVLFLLFVIYPIFARFISACSIGMAWDLRSILWDCKTSKTSSQIKYS
jgi:hypothetical protein